jgi:hypothetical protein
MSQLNDHKLLSLVVHLLQIQIGYRKTDDIKDVTPLDSSYYSFHLFKHSRIHLKALRCVINNESKKLSLILTRKAEIKDVNFLENLLRGDISEWYQYGQQGIIFFFCF